MGGRKQPVIPEMEMVRLFMMDVDVVSAARIQGSVEAYLDLLDLFYTDGLQRRVLLRDLIRERDMDRFGIEVHGLKSAAANVGAQELSDIAKQHEMSAADVEWVENHMEDLFTRYDSLLAEIERVLREHSFGQFAKRDEANLPELSAEELKTQVGEALGKLEDFCSKEAAEIVHSLLEHALPEDARKALEEAAGLLKMYEDDEAENTLRKLLETLGN